MRRVLLDVGSPSPERRFRAALSGPDWRVVVRREGEAPADLSWTVAVVEERVLADYVSPSAPEQPLLVVVDGDEAAFWRSPLHPRVAGIVERDDPDREIASAVHEVAVGRGWISPLLVRRVLTTPVQAAPDPNDVSLPALSHGQLTERERDVADAVAAGLSNAEVARALMIELSTVKYHVSNLLRKLDCRDRAQLIVVLHSGPSPAHDRRPDVTLLRTPPAGGQRPLREAGTKTPPGEGASVRPTALSALRQAVNS